MPVNAPAKPFVPQDKPFDLSTWDGFSELPKDGLDYMLDTTALNKKMADRNGNPYRWRTGSFMVPWDAEGQRLKVLIDANVKKWLAAFAKQGWDLASKIQVYPGKQRAYDIASGAILLDRKEMLCRAIFKTKPKPVRIELPPGIVRQDPAQRLSLKEAMKIEGIKVSPRKRIMR